MGICDLRANLQLKGSYSLDSNHIAYDKCCRSGADYRVNKIGKDRVTKSANMEELTSVRTETKDLNTIADNK